jgi:precorrin-4/cobalt-precorrin-4 C11-methyltransferase
MERVREVEFAMESDAAQDAPVYERLAEDIAKETDAGRTVAYLTIGDPFTFSTYCYTLEALLRLRPGLPHRTLPGITSYNALAAQAGWPVGVGKETLLVLPCPDEPFALEQALLAHDAVVLMKLGPRLRWVVERLERLGLLENAVLGARVGLPEGQTWRGRAILEAPEDAGYLATLLVRRAPPAPRLPSDAAAAQATRVVFVGAGPGADDLISVRGARLLGEADLILFAGSLVSRNLVDQWRRPDAEVVDTQGLNLDEQEEHFRQARERGLRLVVRLHTGDPAIYGATAEQMRRLEKLGIPWEVVPGVSSFLASAAALGCELTKPGISQTIILTRTDGRSSPVPPAENLRSLAEHRATLCLFLSGARLEETVAELASVYGADTPAALVYKASWPQQRLHRGTLGSLLEGLNLDEWKLSTMLLVGNALAAEGGTESALYAASFSHGTRQAPV